VVQQVRAAADAIVRRQKSRVRLQIGTVIAVPRAALIADELAETAEFFCFQTDALTALAFGDQPGDLGGRNTMSGAKVSPSDSEPGWDAAGVGQLMAIGARKGREVRPELKCGWAGEAAIDPAGIRFATKIGIQYVLCVPACVPMARLAAAQAVLSR
jgi:pyruvate,orthophosphate dikinase